MASKYAFERVKTKRLPKELEDMGNELFAWCNASNMRETADSVKSRRVNFKDTLDKLVTDIKESLNAAMDKGETTATVEINVSSDYVELLMPLLKKQKFDVTYIAGVYSEDICSTPKDRLIIKWGEK